MLMILWSLHLKKKTDCQQSHKRKTLRYLLVSWSYEVVLMEWCDLLIVIFTILILTSVCVSVFSKNTFIQKRKREEILSLLPNALWNDTPWTDVAHHHLPLQVVAAAEFMSFFLSVTAALMQHLKTLFFTSSWTSVAPTHWNWKSECGFWDWITCEAELWPKQP